METTTVNGVTVTIFSTTALVVTVLSTFAALVIVAGIIISVIVLRMKYLRELSHSAPADPLYAIPNDPLYDVPDERPEHFQMTPSAAYGIIEIKES